MSVSFSRIVYIALFKYDLWAELITTSFFLLTKEVLLNIFYCIGEESTRRSV